MSTETHQKGSLDRYRSQCDSNDAPHIFQNNPRRWWFTRFARGLPSRLFVTRDIHFYFVCSWYGGFLENRICFDYTCYGLINRFGKKFSGKLSDQNILCYVVLNFDSEKLHFILIVWSNKYDLASIRIDVEVEKKSLQKIFVTTKPLSYDKLFLYHLH